MFQPRVGRANFQPRVGRGDNSIIDSNELGDNDEVVPQSSDAVSYGFASYPQYFNPIRPVRASFQPRIGRSVTTPKMDDYKQEKH